MGALLAGIKINDWPLAKGGGIIMKKGGSQMQIQKIHGGDIYRNQVRFDFSVNVNPLGIPKKVTTALHDAVGLCGRYPDIMAEKLKNAVSNLLSAPEECFLFGNGSSELFMAIAHGILPKKTVIPIPSFYGYEHVSKAVGGELFFYETKEDNHFCVTEDLCDVLTEDTDLLFLANPNNPAGNLIDKKALATILCHCLDKEIYVVLDECFIDFCGREYSMVSELMQFDNLILIGAFTKIFSIPGVRLGYLLCSNLTLLSKIRKQIPEWNLSCFAQEAGCVCAAQTEYLEKTAGYVKKERDFLEKGLRKIGIRIFPSVANFILIYSECPLYEKLQKRGILIRDCSNFRGMHQGYYRIAVKTREENEILLKAVEEAICEK